MVLSKEAFDGATSIGLSIPLLINTAAAINSDRNALKNSQATYKGSKAALAPLFAAQRTALDSAYSWCFTARDVLRTFCGRGPNEGWVASGFQSDSLAIPRKFDELYTLVETLQGYFTAHPGHQNADLDVTAEFAGITLASLGNAHSAVVAQRADVTANRQDRDAKRRALRTRLSGLCKELSQRLGPLDARWRDFGFNMPGAPTMPRVPTNVVVTPLPDARLQVACDASPSATLYRFFYQRPIEDPEPIFAGNASGPLFVTETLEPNQAYLVYVSAVNNGAESELSAPVSATAVQAAAA
jgi:hypothetical protein